MVHRIEVIGRVAPGQRLQRRLSRPPPSQGAVVLLQERSSMAILAAAHATQLQR